MHIKEWNKKQKGIFRMNSEHEVVRKRIKIIQMAREKYDNSMYGRGMTKTDIIKDIRKDIDHIKNPLKFDGEY